MKTRRKFLSLILVVLMVLEITSANVAVVAFDDLNEYENLAEQLDVELNEKLEEQQDKLDIIFAAGEYGVYDDRFVYIVENDYVELICYNDGETGTVSIPSLIEGMPVKSIAPFAFAQNSTISELIIPDSVLEIGMGAFFSCDELLNVEIGDGITKIEKFTFAECDFIKNVKLGESVLEIGAAAFADCYNLEQIYIPDSVETISDFSFHLCESLKSIQLGNDTEVIGKYAFSQCVYLECVLGGENLKRIDDFAFQYCYSLKTFEFSNSLESVGKFAFLSSFLLGDAVIGVSTKSVDKYAFIMCSSLENIVIDNCFEVIKENGFLTYFPIDNVYVYSTDVVFGESSIGFAFYELREIDRESFSKKWAQAMLASYFGDDEEYDSIMNELETYMVPCVEPKPLSTIHCYLGSTAETYAVENGFDYVLFESYIPSETEANCITKGSITYTCPCGCGDSYKTESDYNKENHIGKTELRNEVIGSCLADGYSGDIYCLDCGECIKTGEVVVSNGHIDSDNNNICDSCKADLTPPHTHTPETVVIPATCTASGVKYDICAECAEPIGQPEIIGATGHTHIETNRINPSCTEPGVITYTCHCKDSYTESIPANGHTSGEWEIVVEATYESNGKKVIKCTVCNEVLQEESIPKLIKPIVVDEKTGVEIEHNGNYNGYVDVSVEETFDGDAFNIVSLAIGASKNKVFDIKLLVNGETVQPNGKVTVKIPVPEGYNPNSCFVYYINSEKGTVENISSRYENGYIIFETDHFSFYAVVDKSSIVEMPDSTENPEEPSDAKDDCSCNCHAGGIKAFFFKILNFFQKLFGKNKVCDCGMKH